MQSPLIIPASVLIVKFKFVIFHTSLHKLWYTIVKGNAIVIYHFREHFSRKLPKMYPKIVDYCIFSQAFDQISAYFDKKPQICMTIYLNIVYSQNSQKAHYLGIGKITESATLSSIPKIVYFRIFWE